MKFLKHSTALLTGATCLATLAGFIYVSCNNPVSTTPDNASRVQGIWKLSFIRNYSIEDTNISDNIPPVEKADTVIDTSLFHKVMANKTGYAYIYRKYSYGDSLMYNVERNPFYFKKGDTTNHHYSDTVWPDGFEKDFIILKTVNGKLIKGIGSASKNGNAFKAEIEEYTSEPYNGSFPPTYYPKDSNETTDSTYRMHK